MERNSKIVVYAYPGKYSYWLEALLEWQEVDCEFNYVKKVPENYGDLSNVYDIIFFNVPMDKWDVEKVRNTLEDLLMAPFSDVYIVGNHLHEDVEQIGGAIIGQEHASPLLQFYDMLDSHDVQKKRLGLMETLKTEISIVHTLNEWYLLRPSPLAHTLYTLSDLWKDDLKKLSRVDTNDKLFALTGNPLVLRGSQSIMEYVEDKIDKVRTYSKGGKTVSLVFAENHRDLIAISCLREEPNNILLIVDHTRMDDIVHVRTSKDLSAIDVARVFRDKAKGDDLRAMFFLQNTPASIGKTLSTFFFESE